MHDAIYLNDFTNGVLDCISWEPQEPQEPAGRPPRHASWPHNMHEVPPSRGVIDRTMHSAGFTGYKQDPAVVPRYFIPDFGGLFQMPSDPQNRTYYRVVPVHQLKDFFHERSRARLSVSCLQHRYGMTHREREQKGAYKRSRERHYSVRGFAMMGKKDIPFSRYHGTFGREGV